MDTGHRCKYCDKKLKHQRTLKKHEAAHGENFPMITITVGEVINLKHESNVTDDKPFSCKQCSFKTKYRNNLERHSIAHCDLKNYRCVLCSFQTKWKANLSKHIESHTNKRSFRCPFCEKTFKTKRNLQRHFIIHGPLKPFQCDECSFRTKRKNHIKDHKLRRHSDVRPFSCTHPGCTRKYKTKTDLIRHMVIHITTNNCVCGICGNTLNGKYSLSRHLLSHRNKEKYHSLTSDSLLNLNGCANHCYKNNSCTCQYCKVFSKNVNVQTRTDCMYLQQIRNKGTLHCPSSNGHTACQSIDNVEKDIFYEGLNKQYGLTKCVVKIEKLATDNNLSEFQDILGSEAGLVPRAIRDIGEDYYQQNLRVSDEVFNMIKHKNAQEICSSPGISEKSCNSSSKYYSNQEEIFFPSAVVESNNYATTESIRNCPSSLSISFSESKTTNKKQKDETNMVFLHLARNLDKIGYKLSPDLCITKSTLSSSTTKGRNNFALSSEFQSEGSLQIASCDEERGHRDSQRNVVPYQQTENDAQCADKGGIKRHRNIFQLLDKQLNFVSTDSGDQDDLTWSSYKGNYSSRKLKQKIREDDQEHLEWSEQDGNVVSKLSKALSILGYSLSDDWEIVKKKKSFMTRTMTNE